MNTLTITVQYQPVSNSNVGKYVAKAVGRQKATRCDQALSSDDNARAAAERMLAVLYGPDAHLADLTYDGWDDTGNRRVYTADVHRI